MGCLVVTIIFMIIFSFGFKDPGLPLLITLFISTALIGFRILKKKKNQKIYEENIEIYKEKILQYNINKNYKTVTCIDGDDVLYDIEYYIWVANKELCFFPAEEPSEGLNVEYSIFKIPVNDIEYYETQGSISTETKISGGGGRIRSTANGTIKGEINGIESEIESYDDRETCLVYLDEGEKQSLTFDYEDFITFVKVLPQKEYKTVVKNHTKKDANSANSINSTSIIKQLKELGELKESGIITEEEFLNKKKILLDKIN